MSPLRLINGIYNLARSSTSQRLKLISNIHHYEYSSNQNTLKDLTDSTEAQKKKRKIRMPQITLISSDENVQILTMDEAKKISQRRDLKLVKIVDLDTKTQRPVYKLMTGAEYHVEDLKRREKKKEDKNNENALKGEKLLLINSKISEHDLESRIKNISKWLSKKLEVRVVINGDATNMEPCDIIYKKMEQNVLAGSRFLQKRAKGNDMKFQIIPPKQYSTEAGGNKNPL